MMGSPWSGGGLQHMLKLVGVAVTRGEVTTPGTPGGDTIVVTWEHSLHPVLL